MVEKSLSMRRESARGRLARGRTNQAGQRWLAQRRDLKAELEAARAALCVMLDMPTDVMKLAEAYSLPLNNRVTVERVAYVILKDFAAGRGFFAPNIGDQSSP